MQQLQLHSCMHENLNQRKRGKLCSVIKITKNTAVSTHLNVPFFFHSALSCCYCVAGKIVINGDCNDDFTCELKAMYEAVFFYCDLSSDFMLVPHTLINLTGEKNQHMQKGSERLIGQHSLTSVERPSYLRSDFVNV